MTSFTNNILHRENNLRQVSIFANEASQNSYYNNGTAAVLSRSSAKSALRNYFTNNVNEIIGCTITIAYITNRGVHYVDIDNNHMRDADDIDTAYINMLLADSKKKKGPSDESNTSSLTGALIYGVQVMLLKNPEEKKPKKKKKEIPFNPHAPRLRL